MNINLYNLTFMWWWAFFLLPLPLLIRALSSPIEESASGALKVPFFSHINQRFTTATTTKNSFWQAVLISSIWVLLVTAIARPTEVGEPIAMPTNGRDVMLAIDLSHSMAERDLQGGRLNRLDVVKASADEFMSRRQGDRLGLIFFSDRAYLQSPLTFDKTVVRELLKEAQVGLTGARTAIGDAIAIALKRLKESKKKDDSGELGDSRVLILLTDGENTAGVMKPLQATEIAKKLGIKIYTIGVGSNKRDRFGRNLSGLDEGTLTKIAKMTGGQYFRATDAKTLDNVYREIDQLEPTKHDSQHVRPQVTLYFYPALMALLLASIYAASLIFVNTREEATHE